MQYYLFSSIDENVYGPYSRDQIQSMYAEGQVLDGCQLSENQEVWCPYIEWLSGLSETVVLSESSDHEAVVASKNIAASKTRPAQGEIKDQEKEHAQIPKQASQGNSITQKQKSKTSVIVMIIILVLVGLGGCFFISKFGLKRSLDVISNSDVVNDFAAATIEPEPKSDDYLDYTFGYWLNGFRKPDESKTDDILCFETGRFGLALDIGDMKHAHFGKLYEALDYESRLDKGPLELSDLSPAKFKVQLEVNGETYYLNRSTAVDEKGAKRLSPIRLWESGRMGQHFDFLDLEFKNSKGEILGCEGSLNAVVLPNSMNFTAMLKPDYIYTDGQVVGKVNGARCVKEKRYTLPHTPPMESEDFTFECWLNMSKVWMSKHNQLLCKNMHQGRPGAYGFKIVFSGLRAFANIAGYREIAQKGKSLTPNKWHHVALSYDSKHLRFYINGAEQGALKIDKKRALGNQPFFFGGNPNNSAILFDEVKTWNRVLTLAEIKNIYKNPQKAAQHPVNVGGLTYRESFDKGFVPGPPLVWKNAKFGITLETGSKTWQNIETIKEDWVYGKPKTVHLNCAFDDPVKEVEELSVTIKSVDDEYVVPPVKFDKHFGSYSAFATLNRKKARNNDPAKRGYDDLLISVNNPSALVKKFPLMLEIRKPDSITGMVPMLCDEAGVPLGIPVQLSKNWHYNVMGQYLRAYASIPIKEGLNNFKFRIAYGFYGGVPSASHAQLSLVGYGGNGRWDQIAIGAWGETFCLDMDMSLVGVSITDVRGLMFRNGKDGSKWGWTDAGWGGDWLGIKNAKDEKLAFAGMKTAYLSHGPCLTDVKYKGFYGEARDVSIDARVNTLRTNDYARTFQKLRYEFNDTLSVKGSWLYKMGGTHSQITPEIAWGNRDGLTKSLKVPDGLKGKAVLVEKTDFQGEGPWWISFPGARSVTYNPKGMNIMGYRNLVIRSYKANFGGKEYLKPTIKFSVNRTHGLKSDVDVLIETPVGVKAFQPGDYVEMDVEWMTVTNIADDYYGDNQHLIDHLTETPSSWKSVYREAIGNDLKLQVEGGDVIQNYPIIIKAEESEVSVNIQGGIGYVPIRFENLESAKGYQLYEVVDNELVELNQAVKGNDFWQTEFDTKAQAYRMTFNIPLDGKPASKWILKKVSE